MERKSVCDNPVNLFYFTDVSFQLPENKLKEKIQNPSILNQNAQWLYLSSMMNLKVQIVILPKKMKNWNIVYTGSSNSADEKFYFRVRFQT